MKFLIIPTEDFVLSEKTEVSTVASAGSSVAITVKNNNGYAVDDYIILKERGNEQSHIAKITVITDNNKMTVDTLKFDLKVGDTITKIAFNQRKVYGCATEDGTYVEITSDGSPKNIETDNPNGTPFEYSGSTYEYFKATYYNATTTDVTDQEATPVILGTQSDRYCTIYQIKRQAQLTENPYISDEDIESKRKQAENEIDSTIFAKYDLPLSEIPAIIQNACILLAAGYIDYQEFGQDGQGVKWLGEARGILKNITKGKQKLLDSDSDELTTKGLGRLAGYPNASTEDTENDRKFTMNEEF